MSDRACGEWGLILGGLTIGALGAMNGEIWGWIALAVGCASLLVIGSCRLIILAAGLPGRIRIHRLRRELAERERQLAALEEGVAVARRRLEQHRGR